MHLNLFPWHLCFAMPLKLLLKLFWYQRLFGEGAQRPTRELKKKDAEERVTGCLCGRIDVKWERGWPSQVNRLWAVSHSWHAHNYSISSTINGNGLKQHRELKQTPSRPTRPPHITPSIPSPLSPNTPLIHIQHSISLSFYISVSVSHTHLHTLLAGTFCCPSAHRACVRWFKCLCTFFWVCI